MAYTKQQLEEAKKLTASGMTPQQAVRKVRQAQKAIAPVSNTQQAQLTQKIQSGNLTEREQAGLEKFRNQPQPQVGASPVMEQPQSQKVYQTETIFANQPQPTQQPAQPEPVAPPEPVKAPVTPEKQEAMPITKDTNWADVKDKNPSSLEQLVEARYGIVATQQNGKLVGQINGKNYEWGLDAQGNPVKTEVQLTETDKFRNKLAQRLQTASADELYNALSSGKVPEELKESLMMNPNYIEAQQKFAKKKSADSTNNIVGGMYNTMSGVQIEETDKVAELGTKKADELLAKGKTEEELVSYRDFIAQDTELTNSVSQLSNTSRQYSELKRTAENNLKRIVDENPGLSKASAMLLSAKQNEYVYNQMDALSDEMAILQANIDYRTNILDKDYEQMQVQEQRAYQESLTEEQRAYEEQKATKQLEQKYAFEYGDLNSENPTLQNIAIERAVSDMYTKYPLPGMESQATKVQKVKDLMAQGMTGTQAIAQVESEIRNSQRYKDYIASEQNKLTPAEKPFVVSEGSSVYDPVTKTWSTAPTTKSAEVMSLQEGDIGGQCALFARQYVGFTQGLDSVVGKTASDRRKTMTETEPVVGGLAFFEGGSYNKEYGHIEVVKSINADGTMTLVGSNLYNDEKVTERTIPISEAKGFYNNTPLAKGGGYSEDDYFNVLFNSLPAGAKDNVGETKRIREASQKYQKEGLTPQQALLRFKGYKLQDESNADIAIEYINIGDNLGKDKPASYETTVAKYINSGDFDGLDTYVNRLADTNVSALYKTDAILSGDYQTGLNRVNEITDLISKNKDKIGAFDGRVNDLIQKFKNTPDYQKIKTLLQMSQADMRKYFAGSAVTETEMKALQDFIGGTTKMDADNLITMLNTLMQDREITYMQQRQGLIPPSLGTTTPTPTGNTTTQGASVGGKDFKSMSNKDLINTFFTK